jgi:hypothetical protein
MLWRAATVTAAGAGTGPWMGKSLDSGMGPDVAITSLSGACFQCIGLSDSHHQAGVVLKFWSFCSPFIIAKNIDQGDQTYGYDF